MGVPGFFRWLLQQYKGSDFVFDKIQKKDIINNIDELLIDTNCLMHPQCFKILNENKEWEDKQKLERMMIDQIIKYLEEIIEFINPKKRIYIAIDGPAPMAKVKQQRLRRFKSYNDYVVNLNLKRKYKQPITKHWNNAAITPGTEFMQRIHESIEQYIKKIKKNVEILYSSAYTPGEGEHKLLEHLRKSESNSFVVYGLDADLIFLALSSMKPNIFLLREKFNASKNIECNDVFEFVSIDTMKELIIKTIKETISMAVYEIYGDDLTTYKYKEKENEQEYITDFIFICYLLGNDFLPNIPSLSLYSINKNIKNGLDILIDAYAKTHLLNKGEPILNIKTKKVTFNNTVLLCLFKELSNVEDSYFKQYYNGKRHKKFIKADNTYETECKRLENLSFKINNPIELGKDEAHMYKYRYYEHYYYETIKPDKEIEKACMEYIDGMLWIAQYYFRGCPSWTWMYSKDHAPFISDITQALQGYKTPKFKVGKPLKPLVQLLLVLPPQAAYLLPPKLRSISGSSNSLVHYMYPHNFEIDYLYKHKHFQGIPIIPEVNQDQIQNEFDKIKLIKTDKVLNRKLSVIIQKNK